jgi:GNAT superfamily N-acetyltransferase
VFEEQLLDASRHDRKLFTCGVAALDDYLQRFAVQQSKKGVSIVRVLIDSSAPEAVLGYYSLSATQVEADQFDERTRQQLPRYPVPCFRMGRLAVNAAHHGQGLGKVLIGCAVERCLAAKNHVAAYALIVDAKDVQAKKFYEHYGFHACRDNPLSLYLPLGL